MRGLGEQVRFGRVRMKKSIRRKIGLYNSDKKWYTVLTRKRSMKGAIV